MIQNIKKKLKLTKTQRAITAYLAGASPIITTSILISTTNNIELKSHNPEWLVYLVQNQKHIFQSLVISFLLVAVFSTLLGNKFITLIAASQPVLIQVASITRPINEDTPLQLVLTAIMIFPLQNQSQGEMYISPGRTVGA